MRTIVVFEAVWRAMVDAAAALAAAPDAASAEIEPNAYRLGWRDGYHHAVKFTTLAATPAVGGARTEAKQLWDWLQGYLEDECSLDRSCVSESDRSNLINGILNTIAAQPALAAVGGEALATVRAALRECASRCRYDGDLFDDQRLETRRDASWLTAALAQSALDILAAAPPASPLRGREPTVDEVRQTIADEWGSAICYRDIPMGRRACDKDRHCRCADIARAILNTHSLASPPEQPAADPEIFRCNCPHEVRYGCSEPRCPHYTPPRPAAGRKFTGPGHLEQTGYTDPDKHQDNTALMPPRTET